MKRTLIAAILAFCVAGTPVALSAADKPAEKPAEGKSATKPKNRPIRGTVKSFDPAAKSVALQGEKGDTIFITSKTKILKDGNPGTTEDIKAGELIRGFATENAEGKWEALSISLGKPSARAVPPAEKGKEGEKKSK
jgi:Cu/Ag efflux protein CusF